MDRLREYDSKLREKATETYKELQRLGKRRNLFDHIRHNIEDTRRGSDSELRLRIINRRHLEVESGDRSHLVTDYISPETCQDPVYRKLGKVQRALWDVKGEHYSGWAGGIYHEITQVLFEKIEERKMTEEEYKRLQRASIASLADEWVSKMEAKYSSKSA